MKKTICFLTFIFIASLVFSQDKLLNTLPLIDGKVNYTGVVQVDSVKKEELYRRAKRWFVDTYNSAKDVTQLDDKENGEIIIKGFFEINVPVLWVIQTNDIWETFTIQVKDGRYKYEITDFHAPSTTGDLEPLENWKSPKTDVGYYKKKCILIDTHIKELITSLEKYIKTQPKDNW